MEGLFLRHEGYCGALGAFLSTLESADGTGGGDAAAHAAAHAAAADAVDA
jgi:hypothetical protein